MKHLYPLTWLAVLLLLPEPVRAEVCDKERPNWDGIPVSAWEEALALALSPAGLVLLAASILAVRFKSLWGALIVVLLWTGLVSVLTMLDPTGLREPAMAEGCIGSPSLFIACIAMICVAMILYTAPRGASND